MSMRIVAVAALVAAAGLGLAGPAGAEERTCKGSLGQVTVDNVRVPAGHTCTMTGTYVKGTVKVESRATLNASGVRVVGNIQAENHRSV
ncbi:MAG: hypothetical protein ACREX8_19290, partial [Gammaproteobacteria bacterium]